MSTYYVATTGNNSDPGTLVAPFLTIAHGLGVLASGDTLYIRSGTYTARIFEVDFGATGTAWTAGNYIIVAGYPGETVTVRVGSGGNIARFQDASVHHVLLRDLILDGLDAGGASGAAVVYGADASHDLRFDTVEVKDGEGNGFLLGGTAHELRTCNVHGNGREGIVYGVYNHANGADLTCDNTSVIGGRYWDNESWGVRVGSSAGDHNVTGTVVERVTAYTNGYHRGLGGLSPGNGGGILMCDVGNLARNNICYDNETGLTFYGLSGKTATGLKAYNNTITDNGTGVEVSNESGPVVGAELKNTLLFGNSTATVDHGTGTVFAMNLMTNPAYTNAGARDYTLLVGSAAIDTGMSIVAVPDDFLGAPRFTGTYDRGAYEMAAGVGFASGVGAAAGTSIASSVGKSLAAAMGVVACLSVSTGVGASDGLAPAIGTAAGTSTAAAVGLSAGIAAGVGLAAGTSTATAVGAATTSEPPPVTGLGLQACVLTVPAKSTGAGVQTVTGVVDQQGTPFIGAVFVFHGSSPLNTLASGAVSFIDNNFQRSIGVDTGPGGMQTANASAAMFLPWPFNLKLTTLAYTGVASVLAVRVRALAGSLITRTATISAVRTGEFDLNYTVNDITGDAYTVLVLGGDDLEVAADRLTSLSLSMGFAPEAILFAPQARVPGGSTLQSNGFVADGSYGWATRTSGMGTSSVGVATNAGGISRYQRTALSYSNLGGLNETVTAWSGTGATVTGTTGAVAWVGLGGIQAAAGTLTQPVVPGPQIVTTGLANRVVLLSSVGAPTNASVATDQAEWAFGMYDGTRQSVLWVGEDVVGNVPAHGARLLTDTDGLLFGTPAAAATTFPSRAQFVGLDPVAGTFTLNWSASDGVAREVLWLALGDAVVDTPEYPPTPPGPGPAVTRAIYVPTSGVGGSEGGMAVLRTLAVPQARRALDVPPLPRMMAVPTKEQQGR